MAMRLFAVGTSKKDIFAVLSQDMDADNIPSQYGGASERELYESDEEVALAAFVRALNARHCIKSDHVL